MAVNLSPVLGVAGQFFDNNGNPLAGGKIFTYAAGTTTNQATYTSATGLIAHSNPIILDAAGRVPSGEIWLTDGLSYKFVIKTSLDTLIGSFDNLVGINSNFINFLTETEIQTATAGQTVFTLTTMQYQPNTNSLTVYVDGVNQYDGVTYAYVETSSTVITFTAGLHVGALVKFTTAQTLSSGVTDASLVTYDPPFTGSVPTTVQAKLEQEFSTIDFGDTDGVGTVTLNVPAEYTTIQDAFDFLANKSIVAGTTVEIKVADGTYTVANSITVDHPNGNQIKLIGNITTPSNCILQFNSTDGVYVPVGCCLKEINGFELQKLGAKTNFGIFTFGGEISKVGPMIVVDNFYYGVSALNGGVVYADGTSVTDRVLVTNAGDVAFWSVSGSFMSCVYGEAQYANDSPNNLGGGFVAEFSSAMVANYAKAFGCYLCGFASQSSSSIRAWGMTSEQNGLGIKTGSLGSIEVFDGSTIIDNTFYGWLSDGWGQCFGFGTATVSGNLLGAIKNPLQINESDFALSVNSGSLSVNGNTPENATTGDAYVDMKSATNKSSIVRAFVNGVEKGRLIYSGVSSVWELSAASKVLLRAFDSGKTTIGKALPTATDTTAIGVQIPYTENNPTGVVTDNEAGYVSLVFDANNNRLCVYSGGWKTVQLT